MKQLPFEEVYFGKKALLNTQARQKQCESASKNSSCFFVPFRGEKISVCSACHGEVKDEAGCNLWLFYFSALRCFLILISSANIRRMLLAGESRLSVSQVQ